MQTFLSDLQYAAHAVGFFYVEGHGLPPDFDVRALAAARRLFAMSAEAKAAVDYAGSASFRGYMVQVSACLIPAVARRVLAVYARGREAPS